MNLNIRDLKVIITAGGSGLGLAMAQTFIQNGARVALCDIDSNALSRAKEEVGPIFAGEADIGVAEEVDAFIEESISALGGVDVLINNAGIAGPGGRLEDLAETGWRRTLDVNLTGMFLTTRRVIPHLKRQRSGSIINIASTAGLWGFPYRAPYCVSKWGVIGLTKTLAMELGPHNIRVNAICPGSLNNPRMEEVIRLEMLATNRSEAEVRTGFTQQVSMQTFIDMEEIAAQAVYLCSPFGKHISGQALSIDGHTETMRA